MGRQTTTTTMAAGKHVILGGLGNVGRHLQRALLAHGRSVRVIDRPSLVGGSDGSSSVVHPSIDFVPYALGWDDPAKLCAALKDAETVYSVVTPDVQKGTVKDFVNTNQIGMEHLVQACQEVGVPKLVYASSLAVTNHLRSSKNETEEDSLPPIDTYQSFYDLTKRQGEDVILGANDGTNLRTCAIRLGGILAGPTDYYMRRHLEMGPESGRIITAESKPIDTIAATDVCRAMIQADEKLDGDYLPGRALFVTKCRKGVACTADEVAQLLGDLMGWQVLVLPKAVLSGMQATMWLRYSLSALVQDKDNLPGIPPHLFLQYTQYEQTFDNSLAHKVLDFEPEQTWEQAVEAIIKDYRNS